MKKSSTKPKGATSYKQTAFGIVPRAKLLILEIEGTQKGIEFVAQNYQSEIALETILTIHKIAFGWIFSDWAGKFRTIRVEYSGKEAPLPHLLPQLIANLCADLTERLKHLDHENMKSVVELIAWFQHRFVQIHPFQDYNGRLSRMMTIMILLKLGLPPIEIKADTGSDRQKYLEAMYRADEGDYSKLELLIENALNESLVKANNP